MAGQSKPMIYADWGNSSGRLFLVGADGGVIARAKVPGIINCDDPTTVFQTATLDWDADEAWLCGAVTSNIGWMNTGYCDASEPLSAWGASTVQIQSGSRRLNFLPGLKTDANHLGYFDTMRGEDILMFGHLALSQMNNGLICMPGTHSKWVRIKSGRYENLLTGLSGELFNIVNHNSILTERATPSGTASEAFLRGVTMMLGPLRPTLNNALMSVRTLQISGQLTQSESADFLSGLIIGEDCREAMRHLDKSAVSIIGSDVISTLYAKTLEHMGIEVTCHSDEVCLIAGLQAVRNATA